MTFKRYEQVDNFTYRIPNDYYNDGPDALKEFHVWIHCILRNNDNSLIGNYWVTENDVLTQQYVYSIRSEYRERFLIEW